MTLGLAAAATAPASPRASNITVSIVVGTAVRNIPTIPNGGSATVPRLSFKAGVNVESTGPDEATIRVRFELPAGLRWGVDLPDSSENCSSTASVAECRSPQPLFSTTPGAGWAWDVEADAPGTYVLKAELIESSTSDPDPSNNSSSITVVVTQPAVTASAAKVSPARPKAGAVVSARVAVSAGGEAATPSGVTCAGSVGKSRLAGTGKAGSGVAICRYRTPRSAKGKTLRGTVAFSAGGTQITRRFAVKLR